MCLCIVLLRQLAPSQWCVCWPVPCETWIRLGDPFLLGEWALRSTETGRWGAQTNTVHLDSWAGEGVSFLSCYTSLADARKYICGLLSEADLILILASWDQVRCCQEKKTWWRSVCNFLTGQGSEGIILATVPEPKEVLHPSREILFHLLRDQNQTGLLSCQGSSGPAPPTGFSPCAHH